jgi:hypothetical protein
MSGISSAKILGGLAVAAGLVAIASLIFWSASTKVERRARVEAEETRRADPLVRFGKSITDVLPDGTAVVHGRLYIPAYSSIRTGNGGAVIRLANTLSIQNTSADAPIILERIDYHGTDGELIEAYLPKPAALKPMGTIEIFIPADDLRGGTGANFIVEWAATGPVPNPVVESVMIGSLGTNSYSFVSVGRDVTPGPVPQSVAD